MSMSSTRASSVRFPRHTERMNLEDYPSDDGKKVWLSEREVEQLLDALDDTIQEAAAKLGVYCGLRTHEIVNVAPSTSPTPTPA